MEERHEEILEAIWVAAEDKEYSLNSIKTVCDIDFNDADLCELENKHLIARSGNKILFLKEGKSIAETIIRRHRLAKTLVNSILMLKSAKMEEIACKIEHTLPPEVEESICTLLGHPDICPNGKPIPRGTCCGKKLKTLDRVITNLNELKPGESGKVSYIKPGSHTELHQLMSFGLNPGVVITVHRTIPTLCIKFENTELALDNEIAKNIFVLKIKN